MLDKIRDRLPHMEINISKFYTVGVWLFGIIAIMNTMTFVNGFIINRFPDTTIPMFISAAASLAFNYVLFGFFYYLKSTLPPQGLERGSLEDMEEMLKEKEKKEVKK